MKKIVVAGVMCLGIKCLLIQPSHCDTEKLAMGWELAERECSGYNGFLQRSKDII